MQVCFSERAQLALERDMCYSIITNKCMLHNKIKFCSKKNFIYYIYFLGQCRGGVGLGWVLLI